MQLFSLFFLLSISPRLFAQDFNYIHYDTKDGLAGSTVYSITEDKKGYIWFATDNGVSRFDGKSFTNFTTDEGLTDNEVLNIYADSKGRVWMMPFNKTICYFRDGKIYNYNNDTALKKVNSTTYISIAGEDFRGDIYFTSSDGLFCYTNKGDYILKTDFKKLAEKYNLNPAGFVVRNSKLPPDLQLVIYNKKMVFLDSGKGYEYYKTLKTGPSIIYDFYLPKKEYELITPVSPPFNGYNSFSLIAGVKQIMVNANNGTWLMDSSGNVLPKPFLPGKKISHAIADKEGNIWFSTLGEGVYRLTSGTMKTFSGNVEALSISKQGNTIYAGLSDGRLEIIKNGVFDNEYLPARPPVTSNSKRLYTIKNNGSGTLLLGYDSHFEKWADGRGIISALRPIKSIDIINRDNIVIATNFFVCRFNIKSMKVTDTLLHERGTKVIYDRGTCYIGTLNGLVIIDSSGNKIRTAQQTPLLSSRIVDIELLPDGSLWVATNDKGVIHYNKGKVEALINYKTGLSSNGCKALFLKENYLWVGTNKGINKIDTRTNKVIAKYTVSDGLPSDNINALYIEDSLVWVASPGGLTFFNEKNISDSSICKLDFHTILVSGRQADTSGKLELGYRQNNISFGYTAISFKSAGEIIYKYKLTGLDKDWNETTQNTLSYPSLPPGNYTFQLFAINKFGKQSEMVTIPFTIAAPFWKTIWFWLLVSLSLIWVTALLISRRYRSIQKRLKEKNELNRKVTELEQASLRAQMNPHFIFNCLNSIQHFIIKNDIEQTNKYITQFGSLIRQTLDNAARTSITIADEIKYLTGYMELERMRFPEAFRYEIEIDPVIQSDYICVPSMVLQPFVENAIRHGIRNKEKGTGLVKIAIRQDNEGIHFTVEDNGVGREAAARFKSQQHIEYQSKGITLATNRLELLSESSGERIITAFTDMKDGEGNACGTKVDIFFPHKVIEKLN